MTWDRRNLKTKKKMYLIKKNNKEMKYKEQK